MDAVKGPQAPRLSAEAEKRRATKASLAGVLRPCARADGQDEKFCASVCVNGEEMAPVLDAREEMEKTPRNSNT